ncbi:MAG: NAD-dependent epimerase/dehydratase family protein [Pirellulales bacterium]
MGNVTVITGAAGLVGSHIAEQLCQRGDTVRALVRPSTDTSFLRTLPVEIEIADLDDLSRYPRALSNAGTVYHCAAFVRDWGAWDEFYAGTVATTKNLVQACRTAGAGRLVHVSSISVYGNPPLTGGLITEDSPIGQHLWRGDYYGKAKILAEEEVRRYGNHVILRPSWIYGRRDYVSIPRVAKKLRERTARVVGRGDNRLNLVSARDVARGIVLAAESPRAVGQAYHLCSPGEITQREFFDFLSERLELPRAGRRVPFRLAWRVATLLEFLYRTAGSKNPPPFTRRALLMISRPTLFSIAKADRELGWRPEIPVREGLEDALRWYSAAEKSTTVVSAGM